MEGVKVKSKEPFNELIDDEKLMDKYISQFFDFYTIYELYMRVGGLKELGYNCSVIIRDKPFNLIKEKFTQVVDKFFIDIFKALNESIAKELRHFPRRCNGIGLCKYSTGNIYEDFYSVTGYKKERVLQVKKDPSRDSFLVWNLFYYPIWEVNYGGEAWTKTANLLQSFKKVKDYHSKVHWCDQVLHLQHNTGHVLDKTRYLALSMKNIPKDDFDYETALDLRARSRSILEFMPYVSIEVKKLVMPHARLLRER